ncbi:putative nucleoporin [Helianthus annuus]|nr:putative nucleoporin [Helianthus annuus]KAJ0685399.1 putative nucleoporin [Helianthus annuus]KAJ0689291.1 putative nucleoporin [Helianthus annuus]
MLSRMVMEQLVDRLDVAMFNAILRESAEEMPTNPLSDPIGDLRVLRIPAGKSSFGAGAQLKNTVVFGSTQPDKYQNLHILPPVIQFTLYEALSFFSI